jgi:fructosamine-3-kinase
MINMVSSIYQQLCLRLETNALQLTPLSGGSINNTFQVATANQRFFCKTNSATKFPHLFNQEAAGLRLIEKEGLIRTPAIIDLFEADTHQVLLLEWIEPSSPTITFWKRFGEALALLHVVSHDQFGLENNNYMGAIPQVNTLTTNWPAFFINNRLEPLIQQCYSLKLITAQHVDKFHTLYQLIPSLYDKESPSLLHGDLWSGNFICTTDQQPVLIDPAVYFGHRSIDLGMTTLFGGFDKVFYEAYQHHHPFPANYKEQWAVSNLYPLLIHLLLFGRSYLPAIDRTLNDFQ